MLGFALTALTLTLAGCGDVILEDQTSGGTGDSTASGGASTESGSPSGSGSGSGSNGSGAAACVTGAHLTSLGVSTSGATNGITADASGVYWVNDEGSVWRAGPGGASPEALVKGLGALLYTIAADAEALYVIDYPNALYRVEKSGGPAKLLANGPLAAVAADEARVYVTTPLGLSSGDKQGGALSPLAAIDGAASIAIDEDYVYVRTNGTVANPAARVVRVPKSGGVAVDIAPPEEIAYSYFLQELAVDATHVYWVNASAGTVSRALKSGGAAEILASGLADPESVAIDEGHVYFTVRGKDDGSFDDRAVAKVPKGGGAITYIAHGPQVSAFGVAVDATHAYWTQRVTGGVVEAACK
jgi:hypothetical protein